MSSHSSFPLLLAFSGVATIAFLSVLFNPAYAATGDQWGYSMYLDKAEYKPGDTVYIYVEGSYRDSRPVDDRKAIIIIKNGFDNTILHTESKQFQNGVAEFRYHIPMFFEPTYRYIASVRDSESPDYDLAMSFFFSKPNASKPIVHDIVLDGSSTSFKRGDTLTFKTKVLDVMGNPIPTQSVGAHLFQDNAQLGIAPVHLSPHGDGNINGSLTIPYSLKAGDYGIVVTAFGGAPGFGSGENKLNFKLLDVGQREIVGIFGPMQVVDDGTGRLKISTGSGTVEAPVGNYTFKIIGRTAINEDAGNDGLPTEPIPHLPIEYTLNDYDAETGNFTRIKTGNIIADENGAFSVSIDLAGLKGGEYSIHFSASYQGFTSPLTGFVLYLNHIRTFQVVEEGKEFDIHFESLYHVPEKLEFDKESKRLTLFIDTDSSHRNRELTLSIPKELLDGNFTFLENGNQIDIGSNDLRVGVNDPKYNKIFMRPDADYTTLEILGTSAIPEFGSAVPLLVLSAAAVVVITITRRMLKP